MTENITVTITTPSERDVHELAMKTGLTPQALSAFYERLDVFLSSR